MAAARGVLSVWFVKVSSPSGMAPPALAEEVVVVQRLPEQRVGVVYVDYTVPSALNCLEDGLGAAVTPQPRWTLPRVPDPVSSRGRRSGPDILCIPPNPAACSSDSSASL